MKLEQIFNLLIDIRDGIKKENEESICSCCYNTIENLNTVINTLARIINPKDNKPTVSEFLRYCKEHNIKPGKYESLKVFYNIEVEHDKTIHTF